MKPNRPLGTKALGILVALLSGCATPLVSVPSSLESNYRFQAYTWAPMVLLDANGEVQTMSALNESMRPHVVQQYVTGNAFDYVWLVDDFFTITPNVASTPKGDVFVTAFDWTQRTRDGGQTWTTVHELRSTIPPASVDRFETLASYVWVDPKDGRLYLSHRLRDTCEYLAYSDDAGDTWRTTSASWPLACKDTRQGGADEPSFPQKIITAAWSEKIPKLPTNGDVLYYCEPFVLGPKCAASLDRGETFAHEGLLAPPDINCAVGNTGKPASYADGTVVFPLAPPFNLQQRVLPKPCNRLPSVSISDDNGLTWTVRRPATHSHLAAGLAESDDHPETGNQISPHPAIAITPDSTAYLVFVGADGIARVLRSHDNFVTAEGPWRVAPPGHTLNLMPTITAGADGRIAIAYLGTTTPQEKGNSPTNPAEDSHWHLFVATSFDAEASEPTFLVQQVTPFEDPVQVGCATRCTNSAPGFGAYLDIIHDDEGRFYVSFLDGCAPRNGCAGDTEGGYVARDHQVALATLDSGLGLADPSQPVSTMGLIHPAPLPHPAGPG